MRIQISRSWFLLFSTLWLTGCMKMSSKGEPLNTGNNRLQLIQSGFSSGVCLPGSRPQDCPTSCAWTVTDPPSPYTWPADPLVPVIPQGRGFFDVGGNVYYAYTASSPALYCYLTSFSTPFGSTAIPHYDFERTCEEIGGYTYPHFTAIPSWLLFVGNCDPQSGITQQVITDFNPKYPGLVSAYVGTLYVIGPDYQVYFSKNGAPYQLLTPGQVKQVVVSGGAVAVLGADNQVYVYDQQQKGYALAAPGEVRYIASYGDVVYGVGTDYNVYRINDSTWQGVVKGPVQQIVAAHDVIYAIGMDSQVYVTASAPVGDSFHHVADGQVRQLAYRDIDGQVFALGTNNQIYWLNRDGYYYDGIGTKQFSQIGYSNGTSYMVDASGEVYLWTGGSSFSPVVSGQVLSVSQVVSPASSLAPLPTVGPTPTTSPTPSPTPTALTVNIDSPANGATLSSSFFIANASASNATKVEFYMDGTLVQTDKIAAYQWPFNPGSFSNGSHKMDVKAYGPSGNVASASVTFTINYTPPTPSPTPTAVPPTVNISSPVSGEVLSGSLGIVNASASNATSVEVYMDGTPVQTLDHPAYKWVFNPETFSNGTHKIDVKAYGAGVASASVTFTINELSSPAATPTPTKSATPGITPTPTKSATPAITPTPTSPSPTPTPSSPSSLTVAITAPAAGATLSVTKDQVYTFLGYASDSGSYLSNESWYLDGQLLGTRGFTGNAKAGTLVWSAFPASTPGSHTLKLVVSDQAGNSASASVNVTINVTP